ncbi:hypothetical protein [Formosa sp. S-31]|uniref:hypothetical protein n=1 Tax=Formosa sp. S-31 TaxID=2790949 RepID=UPI003EBCBD69
MKNVMKLSICVLLAVSSIATGYAKTFSSKKDDKEKMEITLSLRYVKEGQQLLIKDLNGLIIYKEEIEETGYYNHKFDLTNLPNGDYYFEHQKAFQIKIIPFQVSTNDVSFKTEAEMLIYKPVVKFKNNQLLLTKLALEKEDLNVKIYYDATPNSSSDYDLIYTETITNTLNIERIYQLSPKQKGDYKIILESNGRTYTENISI